MQSHIGFSDIFSLIRYFFTLGLKDVHLKMAALWKKNSYLQLEFFLLLFLNVSITDVLQYNYDYLLSVLLNSHFCLHLALIVGKSKVKKRWCFNLAVHVWLFPSQFSYSYFNHRYVLKSFSAYETIIHKGIFWIDTEWHCGKCRKLLTKVEVFFS